MAGESDIRKCAKPRCRNSFDGSRWGAIRANSAGWFEQRNGDVWCPAHLPEWLIEWRKRKAQQKESRG